MVALMKTRRSRFESTAWKRVLLYGIEAVVSEALAGIVVRIGGLYLAVGVLFAIPFVTRGVQRIDPAARDGSWGFRILIVPGATLLWPLLARRWAAGSMHPPSEANAHRRRARHGEAMP
jgi:hypothetical protein